MVSLQQRDGAMNLLKIQYHPFFFHISQTALCRRPPSLSPETKIHFKTTSISISKSPNFKVSSISRTKDSVYGNEEEEKEGPSRAELEELAPGGAVYQRTLRLVECAMFAAVTGLVYFLSNSLAIENYFGCFFSLPIVISSMRWGVAAGRKQMVATVMLLLVLAGPVKALNYLLQHGILGITMGALWRMEASWGLSIALCTIARATGAVGYVLTTSFLIRENIFALITINIHASLTFIFAAMGINSVPSMNFIYTLFSILVMLNSGTLVFLLHMLYSIILTRLGMKASLKLPRWFAKVI